MINRHGLVVFIIVILIMIALVYHARAEEIVQRPFSVRWTPCFVVRAKIKEAGGLDTAKVLALQNGYTDADIDSVVRRCRLK